MKRTRTDAELFAQLQEQLHLLQTYCAQFDEGDKIVAKPMSATLRTLLHHPDKPRPGQGSLLAHLRLRGGFWIDATRVIGANVPKDKKLLWPLLMHMSMGENGVGFVPALLPRNVHLMRTSFMAWWTQELAVHEVYGVINRRKIVLGMADQDGGAHVDCNIDESYDAFSNGKYFDFTVGDEQDLAAGATHACIRTIAHEVILTIHRYAPRALVKPYRWKVSGSDEIHSMP